MTNNNKYNIGAGKGWGFDSSAYPLQREFEHQCYPGGGGHLTDISEDPTRGSEALNSINSYLGNNIVSIVFQYEEGLFCPQVGTF